MHKNPVEFFVQKCTRNINETASSPQPVTAAAPSCQDKNNHVKQKQQGSTGWQLCPAVMKLIASWIHWRRSCQLAWTMNGRLWWSVAIWGLTQIAIAPRRKVFVASSSLRQITTETTTSQEQPANNQPKDFFKHLLPKLA